MQLNVRNPLVCMVHSVVPELARIDANSGIMAVRDRGIIALLVEAVKELNAKIDKLEGKY